MGFSPVNLSGYLNPSSGQSAKADILEDCVKELRYLDVNLGSILKIVFDISCNDNFVPIIQEELLKKKSFTGSYLLNHLLDIKHNFQTILKHKHNIFLSNNNNKVAQFTNHGRILPVMQQLVADTGCKGLRSPPV